MIQGLRTGMHLQFDNSKEYYHYSCGCGREAGQWFEKYEPKCVAMDMQALDHPLHTAMGQNGTTAMNLIGNSGKPISEEYIEEQVVEQEDNAAFLEAQQYILPMLAFLPEEYAKPLKMYDIDNKKQADIARELNLTLSATKSRIQRARQLLKAEFITCCRFETDKQGNLISFQIKASCEPLQNLKKQIEK